MATVGALPPPPGDSANFVDPPNRTKSTIALHTSFLTVVTFCVMLRIYTRRFIGHNLGWDDCKTSLPFINVVTDVSTDCCVFAYVLTLVFSTLLLLSDARGLSRHMWDLPAVQLPRALKPIIISSLVYLPLAAFIKLSCLLLYRRLFSPSRSLRWLLQGSIVAIISAHIAMLLLQILDCNPTAKLWNILTPGHCINPKIGPYTSGAINVISDLYVLLVPISTIWALNMKLDRKVKLLLVFGLGTFSCIASIIRLGMTPVLFTHYDLTWNYSLISICSVTEVNVGIICACLPTFPAFVDRHGPRTFGSLISRLLSYLPSRLSERSSGSSGHKKYVDPSCSDRQRSDDIVLEGSEYARLTSDSKLVSIQDEPENNTANEQSHSFTKAGDLTQDVERWPGQGEVLRDFQPNYPVAMYIPRRDVYERESVIRG